MEELQKKRISFSQFSMWAECPWKWKVNYLDGNRKFAGNIHTIFGTAIHETIQHFLDYYYNKSEIEANDLDLYKYFSDKLFEEFGKLQDKEIISRDDFEEFFKDGIAIINWFKINYRYYFTTNYTLVGIELAIDQEIENVSCISYLDVVLEDKQLNRIKIVDIKTSTNGWSNYQLTSKTKAAQLLLYKKLYSNKFNFPIENIDVEFYIIKRKSKTDKIQLYQPDADIEEINELYDTLHTFISECFSADGLSYNTNTIYKRHSSINNCKFCEFLNTQYCDQLTKTL